MLMNQTKGLKLCSYLYLYIVTVGGLKMSLVWQMEHKDMTLMEKRHIHLSPYILAIIAATSTLIMIKIMIAMWC